MNLIKIAHDLAIRFANIGNESSVNIGNEEGYFDIIVNRFFDKLNNSSEFNDLYFIAQIHGDIKLYEDLDFYCNAYKVQHKTYIDINTLNSCVEYYYDNNDEEERYIVPKLEESLSRAKLCITRIPTGYNKYMYFIKDGSENVKPILTPKNQDNVLIDDYINSDERLAECIYRTLNNESLIDSGGPNVISSVFLIEFLKQDISRDFPGAVILATETENIKKAMDNVEFNVRFDLEPVFEEITNSRFLPDSDFELSEDVKNHLQEAIDEDLEPAFNKLLNCKCI